MYRKEILHDLKIQFIDLLLVRWIFGRKIGHKNYEDFEHPTFQGVLGNFNRTVRRILGDTMTKKETSGATSCHTAFYVFINTD